MCMYVKEFRHLLPLRYGSPGMAVVCYVIINQRSLQGSFALLCKRSKHEIKISLTFGMKHSDISAIIADYLHHHLYGESYRSDILTSRPLASCSIVSSRGLFRSAAMSATVLFGTPVAIATWRIDKFFSSIIFSSNIFMGIACADIPHDMLENNGTILSI